MTVIETDEELTRKYHQVCINKHKMVKAIEIANNESQSLQRDIHRLLDVLVELVVVDDIIDSDFWSDSDHDEMDLFERKPHPLPPPFVDSDDDFPQDSDDEALCKLQAEYEALAQASNLEQAGSKRFSGSPLKYQPPSSKPRRSYKFLPTNEAGQIEFPVVLGRGLNRISISRIGRIDQSSVQGQFVYPDGYESKRKYLDFTQPEVDQEADLKHAYYYCSISGINDEFPKRIFRIIIRDGHNGTGENIIFQDEEESLSILWKKFIGRFPASLQDRVREDFEDGGHTFFGFHHDNLVRYLEEQLTISQSANLAKEED